MTVMLNPPQTRRPRAQTATELSDSDIQACFGHLLEGALVAYREDPAYLVEMTEKATAIASRRRTSGARKNTVA